jgi:hypothetical protein
MRRSYLLRITLENPHRLGKLNTETVADYHCVIGRAINEQGLSPEFFLFSVEVVMVV